MAKRRSDLTFKYNIKRGRHGWIRLTPAYSIKVVTRILEQHQDITYVLDPFSGTGTTGLVCAEHGLRCDLLDINPFLVWLARAKTACYESAQLEEALAASGEIADAVLTKDSGNGLWVPPIHNIERWWPESRLLVLASVFHEMSRRFPAPSPAKDLLLVSFCRLIIQWSNASFGHQSMSFKETANGFGGSFETALMVDDFTRHVKAVIESASQPLTGSVRVMQADSRTIPQPTNQLYDCVITSPPYANRMSYIRELRPYMYWLGYLVEPRDAGELDWKAIGGTWGIASSRVKNWEPQDASIEYPGFHTILSAIEEQSDLLANYVHKYFTDISLHIDSLYPALSPGAKVFYVVGNSTFYGILVPTEQLYAHLLEQKGFTDVEIQVLRKRNSKNELFEFLVSASKPC